MGGLIELLFAALIIGFGVRELLSHRRYKRETERKLQEERKLADDHGRP